MLLLYSFKRKNVPTSNYSGNLCPAGPIFLRRFTDLSMTVKHLHHLIQISQEAHLDIMWCQNFLTTWSGSSLIQDTHLTTGLHMHLWTDASGSSGLGTFWCGRWL